MSTVCEGGNSGGSPGVGIMDGNGLILVLIIVDNTFQLSNQQVRSADYLGMQSVTACNDTCIRGD